MKNRDILSEFTEQEKAKAFDNIAAHYYKGNFGSLSKSDLDVLLFTILIDHCRQDDLRTDDYTLSKLLGVTQSRIRTFKQKSQLQYPTEMSWQSYFVDCIKNARYDEVKGLVKLSIPEVNVLIELRQFMLEQGWYDEYQLNPRLFQCKLDIFVLLCGKLEGGTESFPEETKKQLETLKKKLPAEQSESLEKIIVGEVQDGIIEFAKQASIEAVCALLKLLPFGGLAAKAIEILINVIKK